MTRNSETTEIGVHKATEAFLNDKSREYATSTLRSYRSRLSHFVRFCEINDIENMCDLNHADIDSFKQWRFSDHAIQTIKTQMDSLRMFLQWCAKRNYTKEGLDEVATSPNTRGTQRSDIVRQERQERITDYLAKYRHASLPHTLIALMSHTGMRAGAVRGLDIGDLYIDEQHLDVVHRPNFDTPLKNKNGGERKVAISSRMCTILTDYIETTRHAHTVDGRKPLFTTKHGRISRTALRETAYKWTQPCQINEQCPHDRDPSECEYTNRNHASKCPSSSATHAFRRGVITALLQDASEEVVGGRCDVTRKTMKNHYDMRTETEKMDKRREKLDLD